MSSSEGEDSSTESDVVPYMHSESIERKILPIPSEDCFEIEDFTNASDWETFISVVEKEIVSLWVDHDVDSDGSFSESKVLSYSGTDFKFTRYYKPRQDEEDFVGFHPINYYYGIKDFIIVSCPSQKIKDDSKIKLLLSSLSLANLKIPFFVQCHERQKNFFEGVSFFKDFRTDYQMLQSTEQPVAYSRLSGLLYLFKNKISSNVDVRVSIRFSYILTNWQTRAWSRLPPEKHDINLPFGPYKDPIKSMQLNVMWKDLPEDLIIDNDMHSDLEPLEAPYWKIKIYQEEAPELLLTEYLRRAEELTTRKETINFLVSNDIRAEDSSTDNVPEALSKITGPTYSLTDILQAGMSREAKSEPLSQYEASELMAFLFPDLVSPVLYSYPDELTSHLDLKDMKYQPYKMSLARIKSSPVDGIVWRLSIALNNIFYRKRDPKCVANFYLRFFNEIRFRVLNGIIIPGLPPGMPDQAYCLFHQKLQMLNCCINRKATHSPEKKTEPEGNKEEEDDEEEFFDCSESMENSDSHLWNKKPEGRLKRFGKTKLLSGKDFLYIPICQDPAPMTEDQLYLQTERLIQLGSDEKGTSLRATLQSEPLMSDMAAFKAANPTSVLGDFIRWHSPRDWNEETQELSPRMKTDKNIWVELWEKARVVPVCRQPSLFNPINEENNVMEFLSGQSLGDVALLLLPNIFQASICRILSEDNIETALYVKDILNDGIQKLARASRLPCLQEARLYCTAPDKNLEKEFSLQRSLYDGVTQILSLAELKLSTFYSLNAKFLRFKEVEDVSHIKPFVESLYKCCQADIEGGSQTPVGSVIVEMFEEDARAKLMALDEKYMVKKFPKTFSKEFILKANASRPYNFSKPSPQRFTCVLNPDGLNIAGAFTTDTAYA